MTVVIVNDPDNERGVRAVEADNGKIVAVGHLEVNVPVDAPNGSMVRAEATFVGQIHREG